MSVDTLLERSRCELEGVFYLFDAATFNVGSFCFSIAYCRHAQLVSSVADRTLTPRCVSGIVGVADAVVGTHDGKATKPESTALRIAGGGMGAE